MKILSNLCLHFARQDGQDGKNRKENHATKVTKIPKTKRQKYGMNEIVLERNKSEKLSDINNNPKPNPKDINYLCEF